MTARSTILLFVLAIFSASPAFAAERSAPPSGAASPDTPGEQARQGLDLLMRALQGWVRQVPLYAPPEILPNGDIIIRRLDRSAPEDDGKSPPPSVPPSGAPHSEHPSPSTDL